LGRRGDGIRRGLAGSFDVVLDDRTRQGFLADSVKDIRDLVGRIVAGILLEGTLRGGHFFVSDGVLNRVVNRGAGGSGGEKSISRQQNPGLQGLEFKTLLRFSRMVVQKKNSPPVGSDRRQGSDMVFYFYALEVNAFPESRYKYREFSRVSSRAKYQ
jgi:hypothetical protein